MREKKEDGPQVSTPSLQITMIKIDNKDVVTIEATERVIVAPQGGEEASQEFEHHHSVTSSFPPHKDFLEVFKIGLRRYAMSLVEFSRKDLPLVNSMTVGQMRIAGEQEKENSRVDFVLMKYVKRTGKNVAINTGQAVMYGKDGKEIPDTVEMTKQIDKAIHEAWEYLNGKNGAKCKIQLAFHFKKAS